jgi:hypothetical protein
MLLGSSGGGSQLGLKWNTIIWPIWIWPVQ